MKAALVALFALLALSASGLFVTDSNAQGFNSAYPMIDVKVDRAKVMRVSRPAAMIIIGNPAIADATIRDSQTLIITGKQYGTTNLIVLDAQGEPIADEVLRVTSALDSHVVVYKGAKRETLTCAPDCEQVYRIGDNPETGQALAEQIQIHGKMSAGGAARFDPGE